MCCLNGSRKSHCVRKINARPYSDILGAGGSAHLRNFLQVLDLHIFRQKQPGHWAEVVCHFHLLFHDAKLQKVNLALSAYVRICPEMSAFVRISFSLQSYEKKNWHCPAMSSYVHLCPFMSSYGIASSRNLRCKVTKSKFGNVQICPIMSKFVHFLDIVWIWREFEDV